MAQSKFTKAIRTAIIEKLREGHYVTVVCDYVGIHQSTFTEWLRRGEAEQDDEKSEYAVFHREVKKAKAEAEFHALKTIKQAAIDGSWQASAWFLERSRSDRWAKNEWRATKLNEKTDFAVDLGKPSVDPEGSAGDNPQS